MPHMLTVRWPLFARLEAVLFFPVALLVASQIAQVQTIVARWVSPALAPLGARLGLPGQMEFWAALAIVVIVPWLIVLIVADRFLTVRKGYFLLSVAAIGAWIWAARHFSGQLAELLPEHFVATLNWLPLDAEAAIAAAGLMVSLHLKPLWVGLLDQGDVAMRMIAAGEERAFRRQAPPTGRRIQDVYYRETADFRDWRPRDQVDGSGGEPKETVAVKVLSAGTWMAVIAGACFAWYNWDNLAAPNRPPVSAPEVIAGPPPPAHGVVASVPASAPPVRMPVQIPVRMPVQMPAPLALAPAGPAPPHPVATAGLPAVQRPSDISANGRGSSAYVGANEAVSERGNDGGFAFDAVVDGGHVRMLFDTGASVVVLRAEDAERVGINMNRLVYSAKVKTANGVADVAPIMIDTMLVGNITLRNVIGCVAKQGVLQQNLLGQAFLARLAGFNVENNLLVLRGH